MVRDTSPRGDSTLRCSSRDLVAAGDAAGDVSAVPLTGAPHRARMPSADLVSVSLSRGRHGVVCVSYRLAGPIRLGSTFALATRQRAPAAQGSQERYEAELTPDGRVFVSRPHGEPRYPVRARVAHHGDTLELAMQTLLRSGEQFDWRADVSYLPRFPLGASYVDSLPDGSAWLSLHRPS